MKRIRKIIVLLIIFACGAAVFGFWQSRDGDLQKELADKIIRFHVIADNDSDSSQELKLKVKDATLAYMKTLFTGSEDREEARNIISANLEEIENYAYGVVKNNGYEYNVSAELATCFFPVKEYGSLSFPAGNYEALRIKIGKAEGKNWWCVMYPNLCFIDGTYAVLNQEVKEELENILTVDEYKMLLSGTKTKVSFKYLKF